MTNLSFIHQYIPAAAEDQPVLLLLHGTGGTEQDLIPLGKALLPGAALLSPRGKVLENGMPRYFRRLAEGVFDLEDLKRRTAELAQFIDDARAEYGLGAKRIIAVGYSNGANIGASVMLAQPGRLDAGVLFRPMVPFQPDEQPDLGGIPVFISSGKEDRVVPPGSPGELARLFESAGASVTMHWHPGGHELGQDDVDAAAAWLRTLKAAESAMS
jgi:phospholipase/carboxylesterase/glyoxalase family protein